ncbi:carbohydrate deacetylase [Clostridioides sp. ES-S-0108-01]|uniref:carbohydrate deacetylase n=1 Tax=Clostridioides sp. ES-S-0108-01 TaxID=2770773 RepID=UPI001D0C3FD1|nr:carbohydrate deacetylase [Clostridioides sp. ES-S-0108-01]UDN51686.1 carbohydrate deacetylase [Clostridioides sp. ES-S-0107-01]
MKKLINNADDFGYSNAVNYGIVDSYQKGVLTSTTLMAGMPGFDHAVMLAKQNPGFGIGVHLTLTCGRPLLTTHKTLVDEKRDFKNLSFYKEENTFVDEDEVYAEWKAQIEKVYAAGIEPTHLDAHHHTHIFKNNPEIVIRLSKEYGLPVRNSFNDVSILRSEGIKCNDVLIDPWINIEGKIDAYEDKASALVKEIIQLIKQAKTESDVIEVMWHTAYLDYKIITQSNFAYPRLIESDAILNEELMKYLNENFQLCTYQDI